MKKTPKTIITAAMFAAAMASSQAAMMGNAEYEPAFEEQQNVYGPPPTTEYNPEDEVPQDVYGPPPTTEYTTEPSTNTTMMTTFTAVYGPPWWWTDTETQTTMPVITETTTEMAAVYGPPPSGDVDGDGRVDVFDAIALRKMIAENNTDVVSYGSYHADVNMDGRVGIADLVMLNNFILGKLNSFFDDPIQESDVTTAINTSDEVIETMPTNTMPPAPVYGPPSWFEK